MNKKILLVFIILILPVKSLALEINLEKISDLNKPWGSSFVNINEIVITEKSGLIKLINSKITSNTG